MKKWVLFRVKNAMLLANMISNVIGVSVVLFLSQTTSSPPPDIEELALRITLVFVPCSFLLPLVLTVLYLGNPDVGAIISGYFGSGLLAGAYLSVGSMTSSLTRNQVISFIVAVVICLFLVLAGWPPVTDVLSAWAPLWLVEVVAGFSFVPHFISLGRGVVDLRDVVYFCSVIFFMLFANGVILQNRKTT